MLLDGDADRVARRLGQAAAEADVVIDYLWGEPAASTMAAVVTGRADRGQLLAWIQIGSVAGPHAAIPSAALRAARLQIVGSGQGSVSTREILAELPALAQEITEGSFEIDARPTSLAEVEQAWADAATQASASSSPRRTSSGTRTRPVRPCPAGRAWFPRYSARRAEAVRIRAAQPAGSSAPMMAITTPARASATSSGPRYTDR